MFDEEFKKMQEVMIADEKFKQNSLMAGMGEIQEEESRAEEDTNQTGDSQ